MHRLAAATLVALAGCGGAAQAPAADLSASPDLTPSPPPADLLALADLAVPLDLVAPIDLAAPPDLDSYPSGPYGNAVGSVIAPLVWEGYLNPTAMGLAKNAPYGALAMNDLRRSGQAGKKVALLYAADTF